LENHHEKSIQEISNNIGVQDQDVSGLTADMGWFGTYAINAPTSLQTLAIRLFHVHLKDVLAAGGHETCRYGLGVVLILACVVTLKRIGYHGPLTVENEPEHFDPTDDIIASKEILTAFLARESLDEANGLAS
jgi:sugar phosphate isomerase/epimerase